MEIVQKPLRSLSSPSIDFLLLGGLSLWVWAMMLAARLFFNQEEANTHFFRFAILFSWLSILCNHPHFLVSYRFGYGRGKGFILKHWPSLIGIPAFFFILYVLAYFFFNEKIPDLKIIHWFNEAVSFLGINYKLGIVPNLGIEFLGLAVRIMYLTTGWHYAKQAFGCIMVFSHLHDYPFSKKQRAVWKMSLFSVAFYNFFFVTNLSSGNGGDFMMFLNVPMSVMTFPDIYTQLSLLAVVMSSLLVVYFIFYKNYKAFKKLPTSAIVVPWLALHFWWIPLFGHLDFFFLAVPFFHGLQYLLFAYKIESPDKEWVSSKKLIVMSVKIFLLLLVGYMAFETVPRFLDDVLSTNARFNVVFFFVAIPVFINVHHFFIDSVVWRMSDETIKKKLLS